jgi:hypothetical protein
MCGGFATVTSRSEPPPHLLVGLTHEVAAHYLFHALGAHVRVTMFDPTNGGKSSLLALAPVDVAILRADYCRLKGSSVLHGAALGFPEVVFVVDDPWSAERFALESLGYSYIVTRDQLPNWLPDALSRLCALTHARRFVFAANANRPVPPSLPLSPQHASTETLHGVETRFRETFLRLLLVEHGSRRRAAEVAGVPYRSFCEMLRKLDIK